MADPTWLVHGDPEEVQAALDGAVGPAAESAAAVYRLSGHVHREAGAEVRRQALALDAARCGDRELARCLTEVLVGQETSGSWVVEWATGRGVDPRLRYSLPAPAPVAAVAAVVVDDGGLAVAGCKDGTLHWWDLATGRKLGAVATDHAGAVAALVATVLDGRPIAATAGPDGVVRVRDLAAGEPVLLFRPDDGSKVLRLAVGVVKGRPVLVCGCTGGVVRVWDPAARTGSAELVSIPTGAHGALATAVADGRPVAVTGHAEGTVRVWDLITGEEVGVPATRAGAGDGDGRHEAAAPPDCGTMDLDALTSLLATDPTFEHPMALGAATHALYRWNLGTGEPVGDPLPSVLPTSAALTVLDGRPAALVSFALRGPVHVADLSTLKPLQPPLTGHVRTVPGTAAVRLRGRHLAVTGGEDGSVRIWDLDAERESAAAPADGSELVRHVTTAVVDGRPVVVASGTGPTVRILDLDEGTQLGEPLVDHPRGPSLLTTGTVAGRPTLLTRDLNKDVRLRDLSTREELPGPTSTEYAGWYVTFFAALDDRFVAVTDEGRVWDLTASRWIGVKPRQTGALALETLDGRHLVLTGRYKEAAQLWDVATGEQIGPPMTGHADPVRAGAVGLLDGRLVVATGNRRGTVRMWDVDTGQRTGEYAFPADITALSLAPDGRLAVGFGSDVAVLTHR
ncbi:WD40 repeat domain-containing protein [Streptacidiphilus rugosus]|uniref:WD40 repeat domain-containing protein n=1 Tax=Streptacidiphilus rugosus TaxID=405783 RepID=UPI000563818F|nr:WD40 repeat domain-containing protein [Streptacidiphilus rugosus]